MMGRRLPQLGNAPTRVEDQAPARGGYMAFKWMVWRVMASACTALITVSALAQSVPETAHFDPRKVVEGSVIARQDCAVLESHETAIWVEAGGEEACLRYYAAPRWWRWNSGCPGGSACPRFSLGDRAPMGALGNITRCVAVQWRRP
jgi:hypothetical protein